jgi:DNA-binding response OmpR family regulator
LRPSESWQHDIVIMLTARGDDAERIAGLEAGADDYLPKPFNPRELVARIRAALRRHAANPPAEIHSIGDLEIHMQTRRGHSGPGILAASFLLSSVQARVPVLLSPSGARK